MGQITNLLGRGPSHAPYVVAEIATLYAKWVRYAEVSLRRRRRSRSSAEDVVQDALTILFRALRDGRCPCQRSRELLAWMHTVIKHRVIDHCRRPPVEISPSCFAPGSNDPNQVVLDAAAERPMPANPEFEANSPPGRLAKLSHAIEAERERRRGLSRKLIDRYLAGASQRDIEEELSVSNYTVRKISWDFICAPDIQRLATPLQTGPRITLEDVGDCSALGHARMRAVQVVLERTSR